MQYTQNSHHACQLLFPLKKKKGKKNPDQSLPLSQNNVITDINVGLNHFAPRLLPVCVYFPAIITLFLSTCLEVRCCFCEFRDFPLPWGSLGCPGFHPSSCPFVLCLFNSLFFIYFWPCWAFIAAQAFSSCGERGLPSSCSAQASHRSGSSCGAQR